MITLKMQLEWLEQTVLDSLARGDINIALGLIALFVEQVGQDSYGTGVVFGSPQLDRLCLTIGQAYAPAEMLPPGPEGSCVVTLVSELFYLGGHTHVVRDVIGACADESHVVLVTDLFNRVAVMNLDSILATIPYRVAPAGDLRSKLEWLQHELDALMPKRIHVFNHHPDSVIIAALSRWLKRVPVLYFHHADHNLALGVHLPGAVHVDLHNLGYDNCRHHEGLQDNHYLPLAIDDKGRRGAGFQFLGHGYLRTCSSGTSNKFDLSYIYSYGQLLAKRLALLAGVHIHIGNLSDDMLTSIHASLSAVGVAKDRFIHVPHVPSLWLALHAYGVDLYINSFPLGGGRAVIEAMGSGTPLLMHLSAMSRFHCGVDLAYPSAMVWKNDEEFLQILNAVHADGLAEHAAQARGHYESYHTPGVMAEELRRLRAGGGAMRPPPLYPYKIDPLQSYLHYRALGIDKINRQHQEIRAQQLAEPVDNADQESHGGGAEGDDFMPYSEHEEFVAKVKLIAFYLPQFYPFPENDQWWGKGFTEWNNVGQAKPNYRGHHQPHCPIHCGYYDLRVASVMEEQARLAKNYGIHGFSYYFYWFNGRPFMELPLENMLANKNVDIKFCLTWVNENWTRRGDGQDDDVLIAQNHSREDSLAFIRHVMRYFKDERYITIQGKPLLIIYRAAIILDIKVTAALWNEEIKKHGFPGLYLVAAQTFGVQGPDDFGFDAAVEFPPHSDCCEQQKPALKMLNRAFKGEFFSYEQYASVAARRIEPPYKLLRSVMLSWDNTARKQNDARIFFDFNFNAYRQWLASTLNRARCSPKYHDEEKLVFINAWNEWAEGSHLEPDRKYGYRYLQSTYEASRQVVEAVLDPAAVPVCTVLVYLCGNVLTATMLERLQALSTAHQLYIGIGDGTAVDGNMLRRAFPVANICQLPLVRNPWFAFMELAAIAEGHRIEPLVFVHNDLHYLEQSSELCAGALWGTHAADGLLLQVDALLRWTACLPQDSREQDQRYGVVVPAGAFRAVRVRPALLEYLEAQAPAATRTIWAQVELPVGVMAMGYEVLARLKREGFDIESVRQGGYSMDQADLLCSLMGYFADLEGVAIRDVYGTRCDAAPALAAWQATSRRSPGERDWAREALPDDVMTVSLRVFVLDRGQGGELLAATQASLHEAWYPMAVEVLPARSEMDLLQLQDALMRCEETWFCCLDAGDLMEAEALFRLAWSLGAHPQWHLVYSDEDVVDLAGTFSSPHFKPDFNIDYLYSLPYVGGLLFYRTSTIRSLGGLRTDLAGAEEYDLTLRCWQAYGHACCGHLADVLLHRRLAQPPRWSLSHGQVIDRHFQALQAHLASACPGAVLQRGLLPFTHKVVHALPRTPRVSIIIPTKNQQPMLQRCLVTLLQTTRYPDYEVIIVDNGSDEANAVRYLEELNAVGHEGSVKITVLRYPGPFNYSAMNNAAVKISTGELLVLLNNDTAVLHAEWLEEMVRPAMRDDVGIVGCKLLFPDGRLQHAGVILGIGGTVDHHFIGMDHRAYGYHLRAVLTQELSAVTAACLLIKRSVLDEVDGLDEVDFKVCFNDVDLCLRVRQQGYRVIWTPWATLLHEGSASLSSTRDGGQGERFQREVAALFARWGAQLGNDPFYNRQLTLVSQQRAFQPEDCHHLTWDPHWKPRPRVLVVPSNFEDPLTMQVISAWRALAMAGSVMGGVDVKILKYAELARGDFDAVIVIGLLSKQAWANLGHYRLQGVRTIICHAGSVGEQDLPRLREVACHFDRLVVGDESSARRCKKICADVRVAGPCLDAALWPVGAAMGNRDHHDRRPKVALWLGRRGHQRSPWLQEVIQRWQDQITWVWIGVCPPALRAQVAELRAPPLPSMAVNFWSSLDVDALWLPSTYREDNPVSLLEPAYCGYAIQASRASDELPIEVIAPRAASWNKVLEAAITDHRQGMQALGATLRRHVMEHALLDKNLDSWRRAWIELPEAKGR